MIGLSWVYQIIGALISGLQTIWKDIMSGVLGGIQDLVAGILSGIGIPMSYWSSKHVLSASYWIPVIFVIVLGVAVLVAVIMIDMLGLEEDAGESLSYVLKEGGM